MISTDFKLPLKSENGTPMQVLLRVRNVVKLDMPTDTISSMICILNKVQAREVAIHTRVLGSFLSIDMSNGNLIGDLLVAKCNALNVIGDSGNRQTVKPMSIKMVDLSKGRLKLTFHKESNNE